MIEGTNRYTHRIKIAVYAPRRAQQYQRNRLFSQARQVPELALPALTFLLTLWKNSKNRSPNTARRIH